MNALTEPSLMEPRSSHLAASLPAALDRLLSALLERRWTTSASDRLTHGSDESSYLPCPPWGVAYPQSTDEVAQIVRLCSEHRVPVIPYGAGSSIEGHLLAVAGGVSIDLSRMNHVLAVRPEDLTATVQAGVTREALNAALSGTGFFFSVDPGANASIGGMVATSASGTNTVRYGTMRENTLSLTVVTADGRVVRTASRARKSSAGYCLTQLFAGSEGTLGIITEVTVRLHPVPEAIAAAVVTFPDTVSAVRCVMETIQLGTPLARAEMLDALTIRAINAYSGMTLQQAPTLFLEFCGSEASVAAQSELVAGIAAEHGGSDFAWATRPEERSRLWKPRHNALFAALQLRPGSKSLTTDICVPLSNLAQCIDETVQDIESSGLLAPVFGHVGDGNFHCLVLVDPNDATELQQAEQFSARLIDRAIRCDGTCTGEHGVGLHKKPYLVLEHGEDAVDLMRRIKRALDPHNILNPGKVVDVQVP